MLPKTASEARLSALLCSDGGFRNRLQSIGVNVNEMKPEIIIATLMVTANSLNRRPTIPGNKRTGMKTAINEIVIDKIVKPISRDPSRAASIAGLPISI